MPIAPGPACDPLHHVVAVAADLQPYVVALLATGAAAPPHLHLHENIAALYECLEVLIAAAVDVILRQLEDRRRLALEVRRLEDPGFQLHTVAHRDHAAHLNVVARTDLCLGGYGRDGAERERCKRQSERQAFCTHREDPLWADDSPLPPRAV